MDRTGGLMTGSEGRSITIGDGVWIATALLHREHPDRLDFTVQEILERLRREKLPVRPGTETHVRLHCVANRPPNPARLRMLFATGTRTRRLFRKGDVYDPRREGGRFLPAADTIPECYRPLLRWYSAEYAPRGQRPEPADPILALRGLGKEIWAGEDPDAYVRRLREDWS